MRNLLAAAALIAVGAAGATLLRRATPTETPAAPARAMPAGTAATEGAATAVSLTPEMVTRAGIRTATVRNGDAAPVLRSPGSIAPNAYRQVVVTPVAGGRVTSVMAELGQRVVEGQTLVEIYSPELAEAERAYLTARADLELADQRRLRTEKLGGIGAVSQQEVEDARAEYARRTNAMESERARLRLLGLAPSAITALVSAADIAAVVRVPAPSAGVVIKRAVNRGQNVDASMELMTIADLSTVWAIAEVYERDMARVHVGSEADVTSAALPGRSWTGRVTYLDPEIAPDTRTLHARVEVANPNHALALGMLVEVAMTPAGGTPVLLMPRAAVQQVGDRTLVFVPDRIAAGTYSAREVLLGGVSGPRSDDIEVRAGVAAGDTVVTDGAFALKAEWERIGGRLPTAPTSVAAPASAPVPEVAPQRVLLRVTEAGFEPARIQVVAGRPVELVVTRTTDKTCGTEIVIGNGRQRSALPLNQPVTLKLGPLTRGELQISCGMAMLKGTVVAR
jgi:RND family efflux transporter MFP subunit